MVCFTPLFPINLLAVTIFLVSHFCFHRASRIGTNTKRTKEQNKTETTTAKYIYGYFVLYWIDTARWYGYALVEAWKRRRRKRRSQKKERKLIPFHNKDRSGNIELLVHCELCLWNVHWRIEFTTRSHTLRCNRNYVFFQSNLLALFVRSSSYHERWIKHF